MSNRLLLLVGILLLLLLLLVLLLVDVDVVGVVDPITCGGDGVSVIDVDCLSDC